MFQLGPGICDGLHIWVCEAEREACFITIIIYINATIMKMAHFEVMNGNGKQQCTVRKLKS
jgi:hypothetical protein